MPSARVYVDRQDGLAHVMMNVFLLAVGVIFTRYDRQLLHRTLTIVSLVFAEDTGRMLSECERQVKFV